MAPQAVGTLSQFADGKPHRVVVGATNVAVVVVDGTVYALNDLCSHGAASLSEGDLYGCDLECPKHGAAFDVRTGEAKTPPATEAVDTYVVTLSDDSDPQIFISLNDGQGD